ncbi:YdaU family protein [Caballeronia sp. KNU42]
MSDEEKVKVWMPLFIGAYLADTQRLSTEQHGAYLLLIMDYWMNGAPADDDEDLAQITKLPLSAWKKAKAKIMKFFTLIDGNWHHKRIEQELKDAKTRKEKSNEKAKVAAEARWTKHRAKQSSEKSLEDATSNAPSMLQALPEEVLELCPIPLPLPTPKTEGTNPVLGDCEVVGEREGPIRAVDLSVVMRVFSIDASPADPRLIALAEQGVMPDTVRAACEDAKKSKPNERIKPGYIVSILERWASEAARVKVGGAAAPSRSGAQKFDPVAYVNRNRVNENHERTDDIIDV